MSFDWDFYLSQSGCKAVPDNLLGHYMASIQSRLEVGRMCEVVYSDIEGTKELEYSNDCKDKYWLAVIKLVCGPLVQLSYISPNTPPAKTSTEATETHLNTTEASSIIPHKTGEIFWLDTTTRGVYKYGHCKETGLELSPPHLLSNNFTLLEYHSWYDWVDTQSLSTTWLPLDTSFPSGSGLSPADTLGPGVKFELRSAHEPNQFWCVTVTECYGGVLGLSYDSPELVPCTDMHCFYLDPRLYPCGTVHSNSQYTFSVPDKLREKGGGLGYPEQVWKVVQQSFCEFRAEIKAPNWCFEKDKLDPVKHDFEERMLLTVIDPNKQDRFRVAIVDKVLDEFNFSISLLEETNVKLLCQGGSENMVPISWAIENKFLEKASLQNMSCSPLSKIAAKNLFLAMNKKGTSFEIGQKFEFCQCYGDKQFCIGCINDINGHILTVEIFPESGPTTILVSTRSMNMFPAGWCQAQGMDLFVASHFSLAKNEESSTEMVTGTVVTEILEAADEVKSEIDKPVSFVRPMQVISASTSSWCPPIYFNHLCYSASFLSKHRLESLPRFIGSGPVRLVMREVLSRLIGSSFKSGAVLKKLEFGEDRRRRPDFWLENMKGKSRVLMLQADVEIPSKTCQVTAFCREVCQKLSCCPYLFGPQLVGEECPSACNSRPKSHFQVEGESGGRSSRRGKRGRKRPKVVGGEREDSVVEESSVVAGDSSDSGSSSPNCSTIVTTNTTRDNSPEVGEGGKRRYGPKNWGELLPPSEIRTRGAKLPSFSLQLKVRPSKKDVEELEKLIAAKCEASPPSSPPRPPSPKLLRSKTAQAALASIIEPIKLDVATEPEPCVKNALGPAFSLDQTTTSPPFREPPPIRHILLPSNPLLWTSTDLSDYLADQSDVAHMAHLFKEEQVDGQAFLLLNLPTVLEHWKLRLSEAIMIARHVKSVKLAFYKQFVFGGQSRREGGGWG